MFHIVCTVGSLIPAPAIPPTAASGATSLPLLSGRSTMHARELRKETEAAPPPPWGRRLAGRAMRGRRRKEAAADVVLRDQALRRPLAHAKGNGNEIVAPRATSPHLPGPANTRRPARSRKPWRFLSASYKI